MSSKSDIDNRSNQLNPNNNAYHSSRGSSQYGDDDDVQHYGRSVSVAPIARSLKISRSATYGFGAVSMSRKAVFVTVTFHATAGSLASDPDRDCEYLHDRYSEDFTPIARGHLKNLLGQDDLALFAVFDPSTGPLPWHVPLHLSDAERTRDAVNLKRCVFVAPLLRPRVPEPEANKLLREALSARGGTLRVAEIPKEEKLDPEPLINALRKAVSSTAASLGEFQVPYSGRILHSEANAILQQLAEPRRKSLC